MVHILKGERAVMAMMETVGQAFVIKRGPLYVCWFAPENRWGLTKSLQQAHLFADYVAAENSLMSADEEGYWDVLRREAMVIKRIEFREER